MATRRNRPYDLLARFYAAILGDFPPKMNRHAREKILRRHWSRIGSACDLACGDGATAVDLARRGLRVEAVDLSPTFVRAARARARAAGVRVRVRLGDFRTFRVGAPVDLLLCEFSALNHLERRSDLAQVFRAVARALKPDGLFLFDVNTPRSFATQYTQTMFFENPRFKVVMRGALEDGGRRAHSTYDWFLPTGSAGDAGRRAKVGRARRGRTDPPTFRHVRESLWNVCWSEAEFARALRRAGFTLLATFDGQDVRPKFPGAERGNDLYLLARKRGRRVTAGTAATTRASPGTR